MKEILILILFLILTNNLSYSQIIDGYDITDLSVDEMTYESDKDWYVDEHYSGFLFTERTIFLEQKQLNFFKYDATGLNFFDIYTAFKDEFGEPDEYHDIIPEDLKGKEFSSSIVAPYIRKDEAKVNRIWFKDGYIIRLVWTSSTNNTTMIVGFFYFD